MTDHLADASLAPHRLTAAIAAEAYARALYEGYRDGGSTTSGPTRCAS